MIKKYDDKQESIKQWTNDPCGISGAQGVKEGSKDFFEIINKNRYEAYAPWMKSTLEFDKFSGKKVLEVGFGMGTDLFQFASAGANVSGIDLSPKHLEIASRRFTLYGLKADLRLADAEKMPFDDNTFDVVYTFGVIHHTPDTQKAIDEIYRVLKPGGKAIIAVYHKYSAFYLFSTILTSYIINLNFLKKSYRQILSEIEVRKNSDACPLVKVYSRRSFHYLLRKFKKINIESRHISRSDFGILYRFISEEYAHRLENKLGWYLIARCYK